MPPTPSSRRSVPCLALLLLVTTACSGVGTVGSGPDGGEGGDGLGTQRDGGGAGLGGRDGGPEVGGGPDAGSRSVKRGVAYDFASLADLAAVSPGARWWYDWAPRPNTALPADAASRAGMEFVPMLWDGHFDAAAIEAWLRDHPDVHHLLVLNEPNLLDQANLAPDAAAALWPAYEAVAAHTGVALVGPAITWGTMPGYQDPVVWMDAFIAAYRARNGGRDPRVDALAFHWYDYGLSAQLDRLTKYGKHFWVTEFANWHGGTDGAQIDDVAKQQAQMQAMVQVLEARSDVDRYAWFTGRRSPDPHATSLLAGPGVLTTLGAGYVTLPPH